LASWFDLLKGDSFALSDSKGDSLALSGDSFALSDSKGDSLALSDSKGDSLALSDVVDNLLFYGSVTAVLTGIAMSSLAR
jgi:hypothetical protein